MNQSCNYTTTGPVQIAGEAACACPPAPPMMNCPPVMMPPPCPPCRPAVQPADIDCSQEGCCCACAPGLAAALQLLCEPRFAPFVDYSQFAFFTRAFVLGTGVTCPEASADPSDNLAGPLAGEFVGLTPNTCEALRVSGPLFSATPACPDPGPELSDAELSLCAVTAVAFQAVPPVPAEQPPVEELIITDEAGAYQRLLRLFWQAAHGGCAPASAAPVKPTPCTAASGAGGRSAVTAAVGGLVAQNVRLVGQIGDVLILANETDYRFYFVCRGAADFLG